jgi:hypothetical protein
MNFQIFLSINIFNFKNPNLYFLSHFNQSNINHKFIQKGYGDHICIVLSKLVEKALEKKRFHFKKMRLDKE